VSESESEGQPRSFRAEAGPREAAPRLAPRGSRASRSGVAPPPDPQKQCAANATSEAEGTEKQCFENTNNSGVYCQRNMGRREKQRV